MLNTARVALAIIGDGHIAGWHAEALANSPDAQVALIIGKEVARTAAFARAHNIKRWTTNLAEGLSDKNVDAVIVATPSEHHAAITTSALRAGKHVLVEAPMAMSSVAAEAMVKCAESMGLVLAVCHPFRFRPELVALVEKWRSGGESLRMVSGQFYRRSPRAPVGLTTSTDDPTTWTDNVLWHHLSHMADLAIWALDSPVQSIWSAMGPLDARLRAPTDVALTAISEGCQLISLCASYWGRDIYDIVFVSERDTYRFSQRDGTLADSSGIKTLASAKEAFSLVPREFVASLRLGHLPRVMGQSVLPAMRVLQKAQDQWDGLHGVMSIPGRPLGV